MQPQANAKSRCAVQFGQRYPVPGAYASIKGRALSEPPIVQALHVAALEKVVLVAALAVRALQAADQQHRHSHRHQDGEQIRVGRKPMCQAMHSLQLNKAYSNYPVDEWSIRIATIGFGITEVQIFITEVPMPRV